MPTIKQATAQFLAGKRVAVTGVSRTPQGHGSNVVYQRLRQRGITVIEGGCPCMFGPPPTPVTGQCAWYTPSPATCHGTCNPGNGGRERGHHRKETP